MTYWSSVPSNLIGTLSDATALSAGSGGNTGGAAGRYLDALVLSGDGAATFEDTGGFNFAASAGGSAQGYWNVSSTSMAVEIKFEGAAAPSGGDARVISFYNGTSSVVRLEITSSRTLKLWDATGTKWISTATVPTDAPWRVYVGATVNAGAAELHAALYTGSGGDSATPDSGGSYDTSAANTGSTAFTRLYVGKVNIAPTAAYQYIYAQAEDADYVALGPFSDPPSIGTPQPIVGVDLTGLVTGGTAPLTLTAAQQSGTTVGTITIDGMAAYFHQNTTDTAVVRYTVTDGAARSAYVDVSHTVSAATSGRPYVWNGTSWA